MEIESKSNGKSKSTDTAPATAPTPSAIQVIEPAPLVAIEPVLTTGQDGAPAFRVVSAMGPEEARELLVDAAIAAHVSGLTPRQAAREAAKVYRARLTKAVDAVIAARRGRK